VGLVFQFFHLLPHLSVHDNIALPAFISGKRLSAVEDRLGYLLERVGLLDRSGESVDRLSGGEMQRVAICRALLDSPSILLADEPTGNLDDENARLVMTLMLDLARDEGCTLVFVTHSDEIASLADETWTIHSGRLET
jgi:ABC-type lipoprotein export system ATPase subunit